MCGGLSAGWRQSGAHRPAKFSINKELQNVDSLKTINSLARSRRRGSPERSTPIKILFVQNNGAALVSLARKEGDLQLKKEIVSKLSVMRNKEATDYFVEILNK